MRNAPTFCGKRRAAANLATALQRDLVFVTADRRLAHKLGDLAQFKHRVAELSA